MLYNIISDFILILIFAILVAQAYKTKPDILENKNIEEHNISFHAVVDQQRKIPDEDSSPMTRSEDKVSCLNHESCSTCLRANNRCGWCLHQNRCSLKGFCSETLYDNNSWIQRNNGSCHKISETVPFQMPLSPVTSIKVIVEEKPFLEGPIFCIYSAMNNTCFTKANVTPYGVKCDTPVRDMLPSIQAGDDITVKLSLSTSNLVFGDATLSFYDCRVHTTCKECVKSSYPCDWCVKRHLCTHYIGADCKNDILISGVSKIGQRYNFGASYCPAINLTSDGSNEILVPFGVTEALQVKVSLHGYFIGHSKFVCSFNIDKRTIQVNANIFADTIDCGAVNFTYDSMETNMTVPMSLLWDGSALDNIHNVKVIIYRCNQMAADCGSCLDLSQKFRCGWCQEIDQCEIREQCSLSKWVKDLKVDG